MPKRSYTAELLAARKKGAVIVCSVGPYEGQEVRHDPGYGLGCHPKPWYLPGTGLRFTGRECRAVERAARKPLTS